MYKLIYKLIKYPLIYQWVSDKYLILIRHDSTGASWHHVCYIKYVGEQQTFIENSSCVCLYLKNWNQFEYMSVKIYYSVKQCDHTQYKNKRISVKMHLGKYNIISSLLIVAVWIFFWWSRSWISSLLKSVLSSTA